MEAEALTVLKLRRDELSILISGLEVLNENCIVDLSTISKEHMVFVQLYHSSIKNLLGKLQILDCIN
jgi:hypothetical protein